MAVEGNYIVVIELRATHFMLLIHKEEVALEQKLQFELNLPATYSEEMIDCGYHLMMRCF